MTNLNKLIERRQGEATSQMENLAVPAYNELTHEVEHYNKVTDSLIRYITTQTATEAYRQALLDLREGLPGEIEIDNFKFVGNEQEVIEVQREMGHNTALQTVRAQIEELLGKIE